MDLFPGSHVGPYEIVERIGAGGMGEVWRARDTRIGRDVAIKVLPQSFAGSDDRVRRFEQEARAAGALNHAGLVTIFDIGTADGAPYIVMELLEGETLRDRLGGHAPSPLPLRKSIDYAMQIASALAVAHEKGMIHRDLKPENLFISGDGRVKILDFGLAKLLAPAMPDQSRTEQKQTSPGTVMGTAGYMSPEQVRAESVDHRSDIFSLGAILYEMLSGRRAFSRDSSVETMNAILKEDPPELTALDSKLPPAVDHIVRHCLEKNQRERFQSARDLAFQLRTLDDLSGSSIGRLPPSAPPRRALFVVAAVLLVAALTAGTSALLRGRRHGSEPLERSFRQLTFGSGLKMFPTLSPDGKTFAYVSSESGNRDIYLQRVDSRTAINITKDSPDDDYAPAVSPDGSQIAFRSERDGGGIFVMGATGESVRRLTDFGHNPSWSPDGSRLVVATEPVELNPRLRTTVSQLWIVDARTGEKRPLVRASGAEVARQRGEEAVQPSWSPHGKRIAYWGLSDEFANRDIWTIDPDAKQPMQTIVRVTADAALDWNPVWSPDGKFLYFGSDRDGTLNLWRIAIDEQSGKVGGAPQPVTLPAALSGHFTMSSQGEIAFATVLRADRLLALPFDARSGKVGEPRSSLGGSIGITTFDVSPDGRMIAFTTSGQQEDLFVARADGTDVRQLTNDAARDRDPRWSPDGKTLYFFSNRARAYQIWSIHTDGAGLSQVTADPAREVYYPAPSPDGRTLAVGTDRYPALVHLERPLKERIEPIGRIDESHTADVPRWSPDGTRIIAGLLDDRTGITSGVAVYSLESRRFEKVSDHGHSPDWLRDGRRIVFFERDRICIMDLVTRRIVEIPFPRISGVDLTLPWPAPLVAADGSTLYVVQTQEQGDIWLMRPGKP